MLKWDELPEQDRRGNIVAYEVLYIPLESYGRPRQELTGMANASGNVTQFDVTDLQEDTEYNFSVRAYTSAGFGPFSEIVIAKTLEDGNYFKN